MGNLIDAAREVEAAKGLLEIGLKRDAFQETRPEGCWCFGLGGKGERYSPSGAPRLDEYCTCPEGEQLKREHREVAVQANKEREANRLRAGWEAAELPKRFVSYRLRTSPLAQTRPDLIKLLSYPPYPPESGDDGPDKDQWDAFAGLEDAWLRSWFLFGSYGTGKTGLAIGYAAEYLKHYADSLSTWSPILFKTTPDLFSELRDTYNGKGESEQDVIKKFVEVPLLIIDDLGAEHVKDSGWLEDRLYQIIGKRHGEELTTVFTSNLSLEKLATKIGERVTWRIVEMCGADHIIKVEGRNLRDGTDASH